ncbi:MAG TPA: ketopantoate reductase family protein [Desulfobacteraceae bacterium]|nr:ketopantoate reductase family protein [Desulfobacteraceae bacterium]
MKEIQNVVILGAGAMGAYFAGTFFNTPGFSTSLIARGERYEKLSARGLVINNCPLAIPVIHPDQATAPADLIIVALKNHHLEQALPDLKNLVNEATTVISVMNGLDSETDIGSVYGMDRMLYAVSVAIDAVRQGNRISYTRPGKHYFGQADNTRPDPRVLRVQRAFDRAGIVYETPGDMIRIMWWKFMINVGMNQASAVMRAPYGIFHASSHARDVMESLMDEVIAVAQAVPVDLTRRDIQEWYHFLNTLAPAGKTSMLQDIEANRKTEIEIFGDKVVDLGRRYGIPTPVNQAVSRIIRVLEQNKNSDDDQNNHYREHGQSE